MEEPPVIALHPLTSAVVKLELMFNDLIVAVGSGFVWDDGNSLSLVTAWHNLTGTNPFTNQSISPTGVRPDSINCIFLSPIPNFPYSVNFPLYEPDGSSIWRIHNKYGPSVDIATFPIKPSNLELTICQAINKLSQSNLPIRPGAAVFAIGYPKGLSIAGTAIWKNATIASEPQLTIITENPGYILIDTATREGMSGCPVVVYRDRGYEKSSADLMLDGVEIRFLGLYTGRLASADILEAQLGMVWPLNLVQEVVEAGVRDQFTLLG